MPQVPPVDAAAAAAAAAAEQHLLFILLDSNLPTGGFISSSGLESYAKHGLLRPPIAPPLVSFAKAEVSNFARASLGFVRDGWHAVHRGGDVLKAVQNVDMVQDAMMLNHVARRSSKAQGIAMLTLFSKGFSKPAYIGTGAVKSDVEVLVDEYKRSVRRGEAEGHLNVCWGVITAALGISLDRALHLHLFLHARSLLSSAVRLNLIGPYLSSQLLLHPMREIIEAELAPAPTPVKEDSDDPWAWTIAPEIGPATTWPLGELLTGRHDLQHTRIFNS